MKTLKQAFNKLATVLDQPMYVYDTKDGKVFAIDWCEHDYVNLYDFNTELTDDAILTKIEFKPDQDGDYSMFYTYFDTIDKVEFVEQELAYSCEVDCIDYLEECYSELSNPNCHAHYLF